MVYKIDWEVNTQNESWNEMEVESFDGSESGYMMSKPNQAKSVMHSDKSKINRHRSWKLSQHSNSVWVDRMQSESANSLTESNKVDKEEEEWQL